MPKSNTRKLNDTQLVILSSASQREDGFAVLPEGVRAASVKAAVIRLSKLGFLKQVRAPEPKRRGMKAAEPGEAQRETGAPRGGSKRAQIIALMQGVTGATLNDMVGATG